MKGISYLMATVILIAVAVAVAIGFISWVTGIWNIREEAQMIIILPDSKIKKNESDWYLYLHVFNKGFTTANLRKVIIKGTGEEHDINVSVEPGERKEIVIKLSSTYVLGTYYHIEIILESGYLVKAVTYLIQTTE